MNKVAKRRPQETRIQFLSIRDRYINKKHKCHSPQLRIHQSTTVKNERKGCASPKVAKVA